jgi:hypothetical protein
VAIGLRRRIASLLLVGAGVGAYLALGPKLPRDHDVVLDLGSAAHDVTSVELAWVDPHSSSDEAALTTRWNFTKGSAPARLRATVHLPDGRWEADVVVEWSGAPQPTHWSSQVDLMGTPWWKKDKLGDGPVVLPVKEALR